MPMQKHDRPPKSRFGSAAVELALLSPLLCFLFVVAIDYARVFYFTMAVTSCARNGALYGSQDPTTANNQSGILAAASMDAANLNSQLLTVTSATDSSTNPTYVTVNVT